MGRIDRGGGEGGDPALSPPGWKSYASRVRRTQVAHDVGTCQAGRAVLIDLVCPLSGPGPRDPIDPSYLRHAVTSSGRRLWRAGQERVEPPYLKGELRYFPALSEDPCLMTVRKIIVECRRGSELIATCEYGSPIPMVPGILPDGSDLKSEAQSQLTNDRLAFPPYDDISFLVRYPR